MVAPEKGWLQGFRREPPSAEPFRLKGTRGFLLVLDSSGRIIFQVEAEQVQLRLKRWITARTDNRFVSYELPGGRELVRVEDGTVIDVCGSTVLRVVEDRLAVDYFGERRVLAEDFRAGRLIDDSRFVAWNVRECVLVTIVTGPLTLFLPENALATSVPNFGFYVRLRAKVEPDTRIKIVGAHATNRFLVVCQENEDRKEFALVVRLSDQEEQLYATNLYSLSLSEDDVIETAFEPLSELSAHPGFRTAFGRTYVDLRHRKTRTLGDAAPHLHPDVLRGVAAEWDRMEDNWPARLG